MPFDVSLKDANDTAQPDSASQVDRMAPFSCPAVARNRFRQLLATLGIYVDLVHFHLFWTQVVELVESPRPYQPCLMALRGLPPGLARNGRGILSSFNQEPPATPGLELVLGIR